MARKKKCAGMNQRKKKGPAAKAARPTTQQQYSTRNYVKQAFCDDNCPHFLYIGEGDSICEKSADPKIVLSDWEPTGDFLWCQKEGK